MVAEFSASGIRLRYPDNWVLERQDSEDGWTVTLQSPGTAFFLVTFRSDQPAPEELAENVLEAMRAEYTRIEAEDCVDSLAGQPALGHDVRFFSLDLTNTAWTRGFYNSLGTVLVLCQLTDLEMEMYEEVLEAICASIELEE